MKAKVTHDCTHDGKEYAAGDMVADKVARALVAAGVAVEEKPAKGSNGGKKG